MLTRRLSHCGDHSLIVRKSAYFLSRNGEKWLKTIGLLLLQMLLLPLAEPVKAQTVVNVFDTIALGSPKPSGLTFLPDSSALMLSDSEVNEKPFRAENNIFELGLFGDLLLTQSTLGFSNEPTGVAFNTATGTLFITDDDQRTVFEVDPVTLDVLASFSTIDSGCWDSEGISFDPASGNLFIAGGVTELICEVTFDGDFVSSFSVPEITDPEGIYFDSVSGNLFIVSRQDIFEVTRDGVLVRVIDILRTFGVRLKGISFAPSSDPDDDPTILNMYVADYKGGRIFEVSLLANADANQDNPDDNPANPDDNLDNPDADPGDADPEPGVDDNPSALNIVTTSLNDGELGVKYKAQLKVSGGTNPYTWSVLAGALPAGLTLNETKGEIKGKPLEVGSFDVTFGVTDSSGNIAQKTLTLTINTSEPNITTNSLKDGQVGVEYKATLKASGGLIPYTWSVVAGALPPGLSLNGKGKIKGTPTASGTFLFTVNVTDSLGAEASKTLAITIAE